MLPEVSFNIERKKSPQSCTIFSANFSCDGGHQKSFHRSQGLWQTLFCHQSICLHAAATVSGDSRYITSRIPEVLPLERRTLANIVLPPEYTHIYACMPHQQFLVHDSGSPNIGIMALSAWWDTDRCVHFCGTCSSVHQDEAAAVANIVADTCGQLPAAKRQ